MKRKLAAIGAAAALSLIGAAGVAGCSSSSDEPKDNGAAEEVVTVDEGAGDNAGTRADLEEARQTVLETMADKGPINEVMLASDVSAPEQKYGLWVVPYSWGEETERVDSKITLDGEKFTIKGTAVDGTVLEIDQDGNITVLE